MADPNEADNPDPFAQLASSKSYKPVNDDPFAELASSKDYASGGEDKTSTLGAFATGAATGIIPAAAGLIAAGPGAEAGAALGLLGGPYAPFTVPAGGLIGGAASMIGASYGAGKAQDYALSKLPDTWRDALDQQREAAEKEHPIASFLGGLVPYAVTMTPMAGAKTLSELPEHATTLMRLMAHPLTKRLFGGAIMGGMELGQEAATDPSISWPKVAVATGFGIVFNRPNKPIGERITNLTAIPTRAAIEAIAPGTQARVARAFNPTIAQAADAKTMGTGITESVFRGTEQMAPGAEMTANEAARTEQGLIGPPAPPPDIHDVARRLDPQTFARYDELRSQAETFRTWMNSELGKTDETTARHLAATEFEIRQLEPDVAAAYRRAQEATGTEVVEPDGHPQQFKSFAAMLAARDREAASAASPAPAGAVPEKPAADVTGAPSAEVGVGASEGAPAPQPVPTRSIEQQRDFIAQDVARQLIAAGRPQSEALASGQLVAARYEARAARFGGKLGTAEDLYRKEGAEIRGGRGAGAPRAAAQPRPQAPPAAEAPKIDTSKDVVSGANSSKDGKTVYIDPRIPQLSPTLKDKTGNPANLHKYLAEHETEEGKAMAEGLPYDKAHIRATQAERAMVEADGVDWKAYTEEMDGFLSHIEHEKAENPPTDTHIDPQAAIGHHRSTNKTNSIPETVHVASKPARQVNENALSLLAFLAHRGGIRADDANIADLRASVGDNKFLPRFGNLIREPRQLSTAAERGGASAPMYLDRARIAAAEAGYLPMDSTVADFLGLIDKEAHGQKVYQPGYEREAAASERPEDEFEAAAPLSPEQIAKEEAETERLQSVMEGVELFQRPDFSEQPNGHTELGEWQHDPNVPLGEQAQKYILDRGRATGIEHIVALDADGKVVGHGYGNANNTGMTPQLQAALMNPDNDIVVHHNHPSNSSLSSTDVVTLTAPGLRAVWAHGHGGLIYRGQLTERAAAALGKLTGGKDLVEGYPRFFRVIREASEAIQRVLQPMVNAKDVSIQEANGVHRHLVNVVLRDAGILDYQTNFDPAALVARANLQPHIDAAAQAARKAVFDGHETLVADALAHDRPARPVRHPGDVGALLEPSGTTAGIEPQAGTDRPGEGGDQQQVGQLGLPTIGGVRGRPVSEQLRLLEDEEFFQGAQGKINLIEGRRPIITLMKSANASTFVHESGHQWLEELMRDAAHPLAPDDLKTDAATVRNWLGVGENGGIKTREHEKFARSFEQYLRAGIAPSPELASVFAKFKAWLLRIYDTVRKLGEPINDDIKGVFDRMLAAEPQRTVIAPERQPEMSLANIHENDAAATEPHEAEAHGDLINAEADRYTTEPPPRVADEIAKASVEAEQAIATARAGAEPAGEAGAGAGEAGQVEHGGGKPEPVAGSGGVGQERGPVVPGSGRPLPEGDRLAGERGGAKPDAGSSSAEASGNQQQPQSQPHAFAPGPAASLERPESRLVGKDGNIRAENITSKDELIQAVNESSDRLIANGRTTGPLTMGEMIAAANDILIDPATISEGELAATFGGLHQLSSKIWALRVAIKKSAGMVSAAMEQAARTKNPADLLQMWETIQRHDMMQSMLSGVTTETSRGIGMGFRNMEGWEQVERLDIALQNAKVQELTGRTLYQLEEIAKLGAQMDTPAKLSKYLRDEQKPTFGRMILEYWTNTLLSGLGHITYWEANGIMTAERALVLHPVAALVGRVLGHTGDTVRAGEFWAAFKGAKAGAAAAVRATGQAAASGMNVLLPGETMVAAMQQEATRIATSESLKGDDRVKRVRELMQSPTASMLQAAHEQMAPAEAAMPFEQNAPLASAPTADITTTWRDVKADFAGFLSGLRNGVQTWGALVAAGGRPGEPLLNWTRPANGYIGNLQVKGVTALPVGSLVRGPSRMVATIHTSTRVLNYSIDIRQQAYRMAYNEVTEAGLQGAELTQRVAERASELAQNPTPYMMQQAHQVSSEAALMEQGGALLRKLSGLINWEPDLPILGLTKPLKFIDPFVNVAGNIFKQSIWTHTPLGAVFSKEIQRDLMGKNGNVAQEMSMAKIIVGTTIGVTFGMLAASGQMNGSGPTDRAENLRWRAIGNLPHGIRIGDTWYDAHRLGTLGMLASSAADMYEVAHLMSEQDAQHAAAMFMHAVSQNFLDEGFMRGPADLLRAIEDSGRYGDGYVRDFFSSFMPYSVLSAQLARSVDPYSRQVRSFMDAVRAKIPYVSEDLLPRRDIWGQPQPNLSTFGLGAIYERQVSHDPVNQAIYQLKVPVSLPQRRIGHAALTDEQYDEYAGLAGHTAKQYLDALVRAPGFAAMPDTIRRDAMTQTIRSAHAVAEQMMMQRHHDLAIASKQKPEIKP